MGASKGKRCSLGLGMKGMILGQGRTAGNRWQIRVVTRHEKTRDRGPPDTPASPVQNRPFPELLGPGSSWKIRTDRKRVRNSCRLASRSAGRFMIIFRIRS